MSITTAICDSFKQDLLGGTHVFGTDTFKMALVKTGAAGTYDQTFTNYSALGADEVTGAGYTAGGQALTGEVTSLSSHTAMVTFGNPQWGPGASISAIGCIIYNSSKGNKAVAVYDFGGTITVTNGTFIAQLPAATSATAVIRIS